MTGEQLNNEAAYQLTMAIARKMVALNLITEDEYAVINTIMREKYKSLFGSIYS
jgi:hypothetical protein